MQRSFVRASVSAEYARYPLEHEDFPIWSRTEFSVVMLGGDMMVMLFSRVLHQSAVLGSCGSMPDRPSVWAWKGFNVKLWESSGKQHGGVGKRCLQMLLFAFQSCWMGWSMSGMVDEWDSQWVGCWPWHEDVRVSLSSGPCSTSVLLCKCSMSALVWSS